MDSVKAEASPIARLLLIGLYTLADRSGRLEDRPKEIKAQIFPYDEIDCDGLLNELHAKGLICRYEVDGVKAIEVAGFVAEQNPHPKESPSLLPAVESRGKKFLSGNHENPSGDTNKGSEGLDQDQGSEGGRSIPEPPVPSDCIPVLAKGCKWFKCSPKDKREAKERYAVEGWPGAWLPAAVLEADLWLAKNTPAAIAARDQETHVSLLYETWCLEKAERRAALKPAPPGGPAHASHKPFDGEKPRTKAELEAERRKARAVVESLGVIPKEVAA